MPRFVHRAELSSQRLSHRCTDIGAFQFCTQQRQGRGCAGQLVGIEEITQQGSELFGERVFRGVDQHATGVSQLHRTFRRRLNTTPGDHRHHFRGDIFAPHP